MTHRQNAEAEMDDDELEDLELMHDILESIDHYKGEEAASRKTNQPRKKVEKSPTPKVTVPSADFSQMLAIIGQAIEYNNMLQSMLLMKEVKLLSFKRQIISNRAKIASVKAESKEDNQKTDIGRYIVRFKAPYFKNSKDFATYTVVPEENLPETALKYEHRAVEWTKPDLKELEGHVKKSLAICNFHSLMRTNPTTYEEKRQIVDHYEYMKNKAKLSSLVDSDFDKVVDWCIISSKLRKNHTPHECQKAWNIYLKPSLNKKKWSPSEKEKLKTIALEYNYQDWDAIAEELGTSRSGYQCFHEFQELLNKSAEGEWSKAEEELLKRIVHECSYGKKILWPKVAYYFEFRSLPQIYRKWTLSNVRMNHTIGLFSPEDDKLIFKVMSNNPQDITWVSQELNRLPCQIRYRFSQLKHSLTKRYGEWTLEEDEQLMSLVEKYGAKQWAIIAKHLPTRGRIQIRHRYIHLQKCFAKNPDAQLYEMKRPKRTVYQERLRNTVKCVSKWVKKRESEPNLQNNEVHEASDQSIDDDKRDSSSDDETFTPKKAGLKTLKKQTNKKSKEIDKQEQEELVEKIERNTKLSQDVLTYYENTSMYLSEPIKPLNSYDGTDEVQSSNQLFKFEPYKYLNKDDAEWAYKPDKLDAYYVEALKFLEREPKEDSKSRTTKRNWVLPPNSTTFEALHNILADLNFNDGDIESEDLNEQLAECYDNADSETVAAVEKWKNRIKTLFLWPAVLSAIDLEECDEGATLKLDESNAQTLVTTRDLQAEAARLAEDLSKELSKEIGLSICIGENSKQVAKLMMHEDNGVLFIKNEDPQNVRSMAPTLFSDDMENQEGDPSET